MFTRSSWKLSLQAWVGLLGLGLALWLIITQINIIVEIMGVVFGAVLLGLAVRPLVNKLMRWRVPRRLTAIGVYVALLAVLILVGELLMPVIGAEIANLRASGPDLLQAALTQIQSVPLLHRWLPSSDSVVQYLVQRLDSFLRPVVSTLTGLGGLVLDVIVAFILAYFVSTSKQPGTSSLLNWVPTRYQPQTCEILTRLHIRLSRWVWAQLALAAYLGVAYSIGLTAVGVPFALTIGLVGGVLEIVPYLGGLSALFLATISALTVHPLLVVWVLVVHILVVEVEVHLLAPALFGRMVGLHPAAILVALLIGIKSGGIVGVFFAVPVTVVLLTVLDEVRAVASSPDTAATGSDVDPTHAPTESG